MHVPGPQNFTSISDAGTALAPGAQRAGRNLTTAILEPTEATLVLPVPHGFALVIPQDQRVGSLAHFPGQDQIGIVLLALRAGDDNLVPLGEGRAHVVEKRLRAKINIERV